MRNELRQSLALFPCRTQSRVSIAKPDQGRVQKFIGRGSIPTGALSVERPAKNELCGTIVFSCRTPEPMVDQRGLPDPSPANDGNDVYMLICPGVIQESNILLSTEQIGSRYGQSCYRYFLRPRFGQRLSSSNTRIAIGGFPQALQSDSTPCVDSVCDRRHYLHKFSRILKTAPGVFVEKHLK